MRTRRVVAGLNHALRSVLAARPELVLLGEDILDPYGGAFGATRGLSTEFPDRVLATPISEGAVVGAAAGFAVAGGEAIVEVMFSDFLTLAFDPIVNVAAKSTSMYGRPVRVPLVVRCPTGGNRGYGPTHSQSLQKHFIGVPGLSVHELTPFHDPAAVLEQLLEAGAPALLFEDKVLYATPMCVDGTADELFRYALVGPSPGVAHVFLEEPDEPVDCMLVTPGGMAHRALAAMRSLLLDHDLLCHLLVPSTLYPLDAAALVPALSRAPVVCVAEESTAGGTWGAEVAHLVHDALWGALRRPVRLVHSAGSIIPAAPHLERTVLAHAETIRDAVRELCGGTAAHG
jgi:pyruvate/2-oxoglutarate/acetoin dehydrogenase E1 component